MLNDVSGPIAFERFGETGATSLAAPDRVVLVADHFAPASDIVSATGIQSLRTFARTHGVGHFYEPGRGGIEHTLLDELGLIGHGTIVFGADSHTCTAGAFNALGMGFGSTDLAAALATGRLWMRVPESIRVELTGRPGRYVTGKDVILELIRRIGVNGAAGAALEFGGPGVAALGMDERMAVANMAVEAGGDTCVFEGDATSKAHMVKRGRGDGDPVAADDGAAYRDRLELELSQLSPMVAAPPSPGAARPVEALAGQPVDQVYVGNCANGTLTDLRQVAEILRGRTIAPQVRMIVVPATQQILAGRPRRGAAGGHRRSGCGNFAADLRCLFRRPHGHPRGRRTAIATINRNFRGRMGHPDSQVFLANAWVAAASAVTGRITPPQALSTPEARR